MQYVKKYKLAIIASLCVAAAVFLIPISVSAYKESLLKTGYEMRVDGEPWFVVDDKEQLDTILDTYQASYLEDVDTSEVVNLAFVQQIEINEVRVDESAFTNYDEATQRIQEIQEEPVYYTVKPGDNLWTVANTLELSLSRIKQLNPELDPQKIWAGNQILLEPKHPVLDVMVTLAVQTTQPVPYATSFIKDSSLYTSSRVIVKKGVEGEKEVTYQVQLLNGYEQNTTIVHEQELTAPVASIVKVGTKKTLYRTASTNYGVVSGTLTSGYGYRTDPISKRRTFHDAIDIAANYGTPVYAYADGIVTAAGWGIMKGNYVTITHDDGLQTNYLHLSKITAKKGQSISVGEKLGEVGSTGYSTGNHLHFSVYKNNKSQNPWDYI